MSNILKKSIIDKMDNGNIINIIDIIDNDDKNEISYIYSLVYTNSIKYPISNIHSLIQTYPINYKEFSLSNNCKFLYIELCKNEYLFIPKGWYHWIESEPNTIAFSYFINLVNVIPTTPVINDNKLINCINKNIPFYSKHIEDKFNINYDYFINNFNYTNCGGEIRTQKYLNIDYKPYIEPPVFFKTTNIKSFFQDKKNLNKHLYVSGQHIYSTTDEYLKKLPNFNNILNDYIIENSNNRVWFNNDKNVNSGLHCDSVDNILYVVCGKKKILLSSPQYKNNLYHITVLKSL
jgi:hypothetical protein